MWTTSAIVFCSIMVLESVLITIGNIFTIYVFSTHRKRLKRTSTLLINLAVADLLVGLTESSGVATKTIPRHFTEDFMKLKTTHNNLSTIIPTMFSCTSLFCLVHISLERAYAVIWPLRHRVISTKTYLCGIAFVWAAGISVGTLLFLNSIEVLSYTSAMVPVCVVIFSSLIIICVSYLSIRTRLQFRVPAIHQNRQNDEEQSMKLSRTLFIVIAASVVCWLPGSLLYFIYVFCECMFPTALLYSGTLFNIASSIVNPVIYSFRMPIFKEILKRLKPIRASRKYSVN